MNKTLNYFSVCDGIGAAHVAWKDIPEFKCVGTSEIEAFPAAVVEHHFGHRNYGDMTKLLQNPEFNATTINLLIGGTPCQSFSVAGLRAGLADERGNLSLEFARILYTKRIPRFLWENVPGVLSSNDGADFAAILSAWTGHDIAPQPFPESGVIAGRTSENYSIAYRVFDAQYFGVPQRRRRVFVIGYLGTDWRPPTAVLFERNSLRQDFTPSRETRQNTTTGAATSFGETGPANTLTCGYGEQSGQDYTEDMLIKQTLPVNAYNFEMIAEGEEISSTIGAERAKDTFVYTNPTVYDTTQITSPINGSNPKPESACHTLAKGQHVPLLVANKRIVSNIIKIARRLTPLECERLQGFPDNYTAIQYKGKPAADSPRYKAIGNSWAVPVVTWIGQRMVMVENFFALKNTLAC